MCHRLACQLMDAHRDSKTLKGLPRFGQHVLTPMTTAEAQAERVALRSAMLNRSDIICPLCQYVAQDIVCLGYHFPPACLARQCRDQMTPIVQAAIMDDCAAQKWPKHCLVAGADH